MTIEEIYPTADLVDFVDKFSKAKVLVVGDVMVDEFIWGKVERISPEAPVPVLEVQRETRVLGGAANVVNNIRALGGRVFVTGVVGNDDMARLLTDELKRIGVETKGIVKDKGRPTTIKTRVIAHHQQVVRFDRENKAPVPEGVTDAILKYTRSLAGEIDAIVVADYGKGVIEAGLVGELVEISEKNNLILSVDPKVENFPFYRNVTVVTPNHYEAESSVGKKIVDEDSLLKTGQAILEILNCKNVLITRGEDGMTLFEEGGDVVNIPTVAREVFDVTGAGDTVISALTLAVASGATMRDAAFISNYAAGVVVGEVGTAVVSGAKLKDVILSAVNGKDGLEGIGATRRKGVRRGK
ncbi:MAG: D-glycero-beta-D-manno-heptose-7-phosphate kinase [Deltaproteobacteria bacterium]|uniref:D-glycero-beta-D-manno-heptose-7-phosphate kinase n=1 Tax=Candidatus Zymogenus saltonus TaxID=2844893 RepID=A0A9D8KBE0_9DELT|nr:D-glycero-beta-D-manno-heptose-7-phosphate kinase [Candidatus Zymogenus saltonus]